MGSETWRKPCDSCKTAPAAVFCSADSAFLCAACDAKIHAANKVASRHCRVWVCEVCEQAPASVTCKADAAALCASCDADIHSANPLARRHERHPVVPFYDAVSVAKSSQSSADDDFSQEEAAEAASWLLPDPNAGTKLDDESDSPEYKSSDCLFTDMNSFLDLELISSEQKPYHADQKQLSTDGVVPVQKRNEDGSGQYPEPVVDGYPSYEMDSPGFKPYMYNFASQSSSQDVGLVPDHNAGSESLAKNEAAGAVPVYGIHREARVLRYREKRKNRKFEKTIRYASRKAYAETRPRIKGRFAKRSELEVESFLSADGSYGVVPTF